MYIMNDVKYNRYFGKNAVTFLFRKTEIFWFANIIYEKF